MAAAAAAATTNQYRQMPDPHLWGLPINNSAGIDGCNAEPTLSSRTRSEVSGSHSWPAKGEACFQTGGYQLDTVSLRAEHLTMLLNDPHYQSGYLKNTEFTIYVPALLVEDCCRRCSKVGNSYTSQRSPGSIKISHSRILLPGYNSQYYAMVEHVWRKAEPKTGGLPCL
jgi:hypothetical protein